MDLVHANAASFDIDDGVEGESEFLRHHLSSHPAASSIMEERRQAPLKRVKTRGVKDFDEMDDLDTFDITCKFTPM